MNAKAPMSTLALFLMLASAPALEAERVLWSSPRGDAAIPADPTEAPYSIELADDFEAWGDVTQIYFDGLACASCAAPTPKRVELRFWRWSELAGPRDLLAEHVLDVADDHLKIDPERPDWIGIRLVSPFAARGRYYVSVRIEFEGAGAWSWWRTPGEPRLGSAWERSDDGTWSQPAAPLAAQIDLAFEVRTAPWDDVDVALDCGQLELEVPESPVAELPWRVSDVAAIDADRAWALGVAKSVGGPVPLLFERDRGRWHGVELPVAGTVELRAIAAISEKEIWLVGSRPFQPGPAAESRQPLALRYFPGEARWEVLSAPLFPDGDGMFTDLVARPGGEVWLVGWATSRVEGGTRRTAQLWRWNDGTFEKLPLAGDRPLGDEELSAIASDGAEVWMVGGGPENALPTPPRILRWNGEAAEPVAVPVVAEIGRLGSVAVDGSEVWIGGRSRSGDPVLLRFDGLAWSAPQSPVGGDALVVQPKHGFVTAGPGLASFLPSGWRTEPDGGLRVAQLASPAPCALFAAGFLDTTLGERGALYRLAPRGFADGFESAGFEAWSATSGAP